MAAKVFLVGSVLGAMGAAAVSMGLTEPVNCHANQIFFLAGNSGAVIQVADGEETLLKGRIVYLPRSGHGWASRKLLERFDVALGDEIGAAPNTGLECQVVSERS